MKARFGLEYALFFGVPDNKIELLNGHSRWVFPFLSRAEGETHFDEWFRTIQRWKGVEAPEHIERSERKWRATAGGICLELYPRPIKLRMPIGWQLFEAFLRTFNRRDYWPGQPPGLEKGWDSLQDEGDIRMNLWSLFRDLSDRHGGEHSGRVDIALAPWAAIAPDAYYYAPLRDNIMIAGDYFCAAPDLVVEVLSAPSRWLDRGPRMEIHRRAQVGHLWLVEPLFESVEVYELRSSYELVGKFGIGDCLGSPLFPGEEISVEGLFKTQSKRWRDESNDSDSLEPIPDWIVPPETKVGLECFFHLGHPDRRWEFWDGKARSVLAFGSVAEAKARLDHFVIEACRWESMPRPKTSKMNGETDQAEVGRFQFTRRGQLIFLDLAIDGSRHQEILRRWADRDAWDWGDE